MAAKKKTKKKQATKKPPVKKNAVKKTAKKKSVKKSVPVRAKRPARKAIAKTASKPKDSARRKSPSVNPSAFPMEGSRSGHRPSDFEGISRVEGPDSESVDELIEEGNTFEAGAVAGVEEADDEEGQEVHTHEVPEDDVPEEYLDKD